MPAPRRARSYASSAPEDSDDDFDGAVYRRRLMRMHVDMLGALSDLPESLREVSRSIGPALHRSLHRVWSPSYESGGQYVDTDGPDHDAVSDDRSLSFHCSAGHGHPETEHCSGSSDCCQPS